MSVCGLVYVRNTDILSLIGPSGKSALQGSDLNKAEVEKYNENQKYCFATYSRKWSFNLLQL